MSALDTATTRVAGPGVPRARAGAHDADRAVPRGTGRRCAALEARALQPGVRAVQRYAHLDLAPVRQQQPAAAGLDHRHAEGFHHLRTDLAVDAVHDAD